MADPDRDYARVEEAIRFLVACHPRHPSLEEVANEVGLSSFHFQRLFTRWAGVSPKRFLKELSLVSARGSLRANRSVLEASLDAGLSSPGRLHDLFVTIEAMTPGEWKAGGAGIELRHGRASTPFGPAVAAWSERGLSLLEFHERPSADAVRGRYPHASLVEDEPGARAWLTRVFEPLSNPNHEPAPLTLHLSGTNFQVQVWRALLSIAEGETRTYGDVANTIERPTATRAVGTAIGANPVAYLIPCHRVLRSDGTLGGYRWGEDRKCALLTREALRTTRDTRSEA